VKLLAASLLILTAGCAQDKVSHFVVGATISAVVTEITGNPLAGCAAALGAGLLKEAYDSQGHGTVEAADALATVSGCSVTLIEF
jgi:hypothetical protein